MHVQERLTSLQTALDQEADEFAIEAAVLKAQGAEADVCRLARLFEQSHLERFEEALAGLSRSPAPLVLA